MRQCRLVFTAISDRAEQQATPSALCSPECAPTWCRRPHTCAKQLWQTIHLPKRSMIRNATAFDAAVLGYLSIGTMGRRKSTRAIWEKQTGSSFSRWGDQFRLQHLTTPIEDPGSLGCEDHSCDPALRPSAYEVRPRLGSRRNALGARSEPERYPPIQPTSVPSLKSLT